MEKEVKEVKRKPAAKKTTTKKAPAKKKPASKPVVKKTVAKKETPKKETITKEKVLAESKKENKNKDLYSIQVESDGCKVAVLAMLILTAIYYCYEIFSGEGSNPALYSIITVYCSILYGYKALKVEKNRRINAFTSIIWGILTIMLILLYFGVI